jgi:phage/plasmid-like protein (TIGR03299 family)
MSHEVETIAYVGETPWHGIGTRCADGISTDDMLVAAGLDWTVKQYPMQVTLEDGKSIDVEGKRALIRSKDHKVMNVSSDSWTPVQNADLIGFMRSYVESGGAKLETAGSLRDGSVIWGLAKLDRSFEVSKKDKVQGYLLITGSHIVGVSTKIRTVATRVVCMNTMRMAEREVGSVCYKQNHLAEFDVNAAKIAVATANEELAQAESRYKKIKKLKLSIEDAVQKLYWKVLPDNVYSTESVKKLLAAPETQSARMQALIDSYKTAPGADVGTGWGALNGFTHWTDHKFGNSGEARMHRVTFGDFSREKDAMEKTLLELAE